MQKGAIWWVGSSKLKQGSWVGIEAMLEFEDLVGDGICEGLVPGDNSLGDPVALATSATDAVNRLAGSVDGAPCKKSASMLA